MSDSVRPHRRQPTRLHHPWDLPGKNTGVGCHFLLQCMKVKSESEVSQSIQLLVTPWTTAYQAPLSIGFSRQEYWSGVPLLSPAYIFSLALILSFSAYFYSQIFVLSNHSSYTLNTFQVIIPSIFSLPPPTNTILHWQLK